MLLKFQLCFLKYLYSPKQHQNYHPVFCRTTGIKFEIAAFVVFEVSPSTDEDNVPSIERTTVKTVSIIPKIQTIADLKNFEIPF